MGATNNKYNRRILSVFFVLMILRIVEEFAVANAVDTMGLLTCAGGFFLFLIYLRFINKSLDDIGLLFIPHKVKKGFGMMFLLNLVPAAIVYSVEYMILNAKSDSVNFTVYYDNVDRAFSEVGLSAYLGWIAAGAFISLIHAIFYELTFRGLIFSLAAKNYSFNKANLLQAVLYTVCFLVPVLRVVAFNLGDYGVNRIITLAVFMIVYEMIVALKLGLLRKASGSVWICLFDHIAFAFITDSLHIQQSVGASTITDHSLYYRLVAYQAVSLVIAIVYSIVKTKKLKERQFNEK